MSHRLGGKKKAEIQKNVGCEGVPEPARQSLLDTLHENLSDAKRNIYVNRIIYIGEHSFDPQNPEQLTDVFKEIVKEVNNSYNDEHLTGIFLYYKKYFVHMLEGSEDSIMKHFQLLVEEELYINFYRLKLIIVVNHINQRFINDWIKISGKPATLLEKLDPDSDLEKSTKYAFHCVQKVYQLCKEVREIKAKNAREDQSTIIKDPDMSQISINSAMYDDIQKACYPEVNLLQFLVQSRFVKDLNEYILAYGSCNIPDDYEEKVWPVPSTMVPYNIFEKPADPCVDLPTHRIEKEEDVVVPTEEETADQESVDR